MRFADLKNDYIFRRIFGTHPNILRGLLNDLLERGGGLEPDPTSVSTSGSQLIASTNSATVANRSPASLAIARATLSAIADGTQGAHSASGPRRSRAPAFARPAPRWKGTVPGCARYSHGEAA